MRPGDLYAALPGARTHGADFAADAAAAGAVAVSPTRTAPSAPGDAGCPSLVVDDPRARLGALAAWIYGDAAAEAADTLGVTGTNGKTTTT